MPKIPKQCPACAADLVITRLTCPSCGTEVTGQFAPDFFSRLNANDFDFVVMFVRSKGNIKEMERELGISYWTIRSRLNDIVARLGFDPGTPPGAGAAGALSERRQKILQDLNAGLLSVDEASALLEELKPKP